MKRSGLRSWFASAVVYVLLPAVLNQSHLMVVPGGGVRWSPSPSPARAAPPTPFEAPPGVSPDIVVSRRVTPKAAQLVTGGTASITYTVVNRTPDTLDGVLLVTTLEPGVEYRTATPEADRSGQQLAWSLGNLGAFVSTEITLSVALPTTMIEELDTGADVYATRITHAVSAGTEPARLIARSVDPALLACTVDANCEDREVLAKAAELGFDPERIFAFVRDEIGFESYQGSLRGARGTLWSAAGNALDKASLLIALLRASSVPARYVSGTLSRPIAQQLILSMFPKRVGMVGAVFPANEATQGPLSDPANDEGLLAETQEHHWVELDRGNGFEAADPTAGALSAAAIGQGFANAAIRFNAVRTEQQHTVSVQLDVERQGILLPTERQTNLSFTFASAELVGRPLSLQHFVDVEPLALGAVRRLYTPFLALGNDTTSIDDDDFLMGEDDARGHSTSYEDGGFIVETTITGLFLTVTRRDPRGLVEADERTIFDAVGAEARLFGGQGAIPEPPPAGVITNLDSIVIDVAPSRVSPNITVQHAAALGAMTGAARSAMPTAEQLESDSSARVDVATSLLDRIAATNRVIADAFFVASDLGQRQVETATLTRIYPRSPRVVITAVRLDLEGAEPKLRATTDLMATRVSVVPDADVPASRAREALHTVGLLEAGLEAQVPAPDAVTIISILNAAEDQDVPLVELEPGDEDVVSGLEISAEARFRIVDSLADGNSIVVPERPVTLAGETAVGWLEIQPDGHTVGRLPDGSGGMIVELVALTLVEFVAQLRRSEELAGDTAQAPLGFTVTLLFFVDFVITEFGFYAILQSQGLKPAKDSLKTAIPAAAVAAAGAAVAACKLSSASAGGKEKCIQGVKIGGILLGGVVGAILTILSLGDPPIGSAKLGVPADIALNRATGVLQRPATLQPSQSDLQVSLASATLRTGTGSLGWSGNTRTAIRVHRVEAAAAQVRTADGAAIGAGRLVLSSAAPVQVAVSGNARYEATGELNLSTYGPALGQLGGAGAHGTAQLTVTGDLEIEVDGASIELDGVPLAVGRYIIRTPAVAAQVAGIGLSPNFAARADVRFDQGGLSLAPASAASIAGVSIARGSTLGVTGVTATGSLTANGATDTLGLSGQFARILAVRAVPTTLATTEQVPVEVDVAVDTSLAGAYEVTLTAPPGWTAKLDGQGRASVAAPSGLRPGTYPVHVAAVSQADPQLRAESVIDVAIQPTAPAVALSLQADPLFTVPVGGAQLPAAFRAEIHSSAPATDTFELTVADVPAGFELLTSADQLELAAGETGTIGLYLRPLGSLPAPGTRLSFSARVAGTSSGLIASDEASFVVPAVREVAIGVTPAQAATPPGGQLAASVTLRNLGNVVSRASLRASPPAGVAINGLPSGLIELTPGQSRSFDVRIDAASNVALNRRLAVDFVSDFCADLPPAQCSDPFSDTLTTEPGERTATLTVTTRSPQLAALNQALAAIADDDGEMAALLADLLAALAQLEASPANPALLAAVQLRAQRLFEKLQGDPRYAELAALVQPMLDAAAAGNSAAVLAAVAPLGAALQDALPQRAGYGFSVRFSPSGQQVTSGQGATFVVNLENLGSRAVSYQLEVGAVPDGVTASLTTGAVTLQAGERTPASGPAAVLLQVEQNLSGVRTLRIPLRVTPVGAAPELAATSTAFVFVRPAPIQITELIATPTFVTNAAPFSLRASLLNQDQSARDVRATLELLDAQGATARTLGEVPIALARGSSPQPFELGTFPTTGLSSGAYQVRARLLGLDGTPLSQPKTAAVYVGGIASLTAAAAPSTVAPGASNVTTQLRVNQGVVVAPGEGGVPTPMPPATPPFDPQKNCFNLIRNPIFEEHIDNCDRSATCTVLPGDPAIAPWETVNGVIQIDEEGWFPGRTCIEFGDYLPLLGPGQPPPRPLSSIRQTFATVPGEVYRFAFRLISLDFAPLPPPRQVRVQIAGEDRVFAEERFDNNGHQRSFTFTATSTQTTLTMTNQIGFDARAQAYVDDVMVCPQTPAGITGTPEVFDLPWATAVNTELSRLAPTTVNAQNALGPADGQFASLAPGDELVLDLVSIENARINDQAADIATTVRDNTQPYDVFVSQDGVTFVPVPRTDFFGTVVRPTNYPGPHTGSRPFDINVNFGTLITARYVKIRAGESGLDLDSVDKVQLRRRFVPASGTGGTTDFVFILDISIGMVEELGPVHRALTTLVQKFRERDIDARFALVTYAGHLSGKPPVVRTDFLADPRLFGTWLDTAQVQFGGQEPGLEAIRMAVNGSLPLSYRPGARKNIILVTDEDSDLPHFPENRVPGQTSTFGGSCTGDGGQPDPQPGTASGFEAPAVLTGTPWQTEVDLTAQAAIEAEAFVNFLILPRSPYPNGCDAVGYTEHQYGFEGAEVSDPVTFLDFDPQATLRNLEAVGYGENVQAQLLRAGLISRAFNLHRFTSDPTFVDKVYNAKAEETMLGSQPTVTAELRHMLARTGNTFDLTGLDPAFTVEGDTLVLRREWPLNAPPPLSFDIPAQVLGLDAGATRALSSGTELTLSFQPVSGEPVVQRIAVPGVDVTARRVIEISPATAQIPAGGSATYIVTLSNPGAVPLALQLQALGLDGLEFDLPATATVAPGQTRSETLTVRAPRTATSQQRELRVTASDPAAGVSDSAGASLAIDAVPIAPQAEARGVHVALSPQSAAAGQGTAASFLATITNLGDRADTYDLAAALPAGFRAELSEPQVTLLPGSTGARTVRLALTPPVGTPRGSYDFSLEAMSTADASVRAEASGRVDVLDLGVALQLSPSVAGQNSTLSLRVTNTGNTNDRFSLALAGLAPGAATLSTAQVELAAGASTVVGVSVGTLTSALPGAAQLVARATSQTDARVNAVASASISVPNTRGVAADLAPDTVHLAGGETAPLALTVDNTGNIADTFRVSVSATGSANAVLLDFAGNPTTRIDALSLPALAGALLSLRVSARGAGAGTVTVNVTSVDNPSVVAVATAAVTVEVTDQPPQANAGPDQQIAYDELVQLDGSASRDPDGTALTYSWRFAQRPAGSTLSDADLIGASTVAPRFLPDVEGRYTLALTVSAGGAQSTDGVDVTVSNAAPLADAGRDRNVKAGALVQLDGSGSYDPDGDLLHYQWSLVSRPPGSTLTEANVTGLDTPTPRFRSETRRDKVDFVFLVDTSESLQDEIVAVRAGLSGFIQNLASRALDVRYAVVRITTRPTLIANFTSSSQAITQTFQDLQVTPCSSDPACRARGNQDEPGLEAIRLVLGAGGGGFPALAFRSDARINLILVTDEDSDRATSTPPLSGQTTPEPPDVITGTAWQTEVNQTAALAISRGAFVNMLVNPTDAPTRSQYGDPGSDVANPVTLLDFDRMATLSRLETNGHGMSLEAQLLRAGLVARAFDIANVSQPAFVNNFFSAKVEEVTEGYEFELEVNDGSATSTDLVRVVAYRNNIPPNADAGRDANALVGTVVTLDGSASSDPDNGPSARSYAWRFLSVPAGSARTNASITSATSSIARFTPDVAGSYLLELRVGDGVSSDLAWVAIEAFSAQALPNARAGANASLNICQPAPEADLDASASFDPGNAPLHYQWRVVARPASSQVDSQDILDPATPRPSLRPDASGAYVVGLRLANAFGASYDQALVSALSCADTDGDGLSDAQESATGVFVSANDTGTDPTDADTDDDGLNDGYEVLTSRSNPFLPDTDGDGVTDGAEVAAGTNPNVQDQPVATGTYREGGGAATAADIFTFRNAGRTNITTLLVDLTSSANGARFDTNTSTGRRFSAQSTGVGFNGTFTLGSSNRTVRMQFTDFQPNETFTFHVDVDDASGTTTTGADMAGARVTVTSGRGNDVGAYAAVPGAANDAAVTVRDGP